MDSLLISTEILERIGLTLIHSLWQASAILLLLLLFLKTIPSEKAILRYNLGLTALIGFLVTILFTWSWFGLELDSPESFARISDPVIETVQDLSFQESSEITTNRLSLTSNNEASTTTLFSGSQETLNKWASWITPFWAVGAMLMLFRTFRTTLIVARIRSEAVSLCDRSLRTINEELSRALRIARPVTIRISQQILIPAVMGILRPTILFPTAMLKSLPTEKIKAILAHELAHIRRNDYLVNLVQRLIESLFYFNPFIWMINRQIRNEREACCDTVAVELTGGKESYAETLITVTQFMNNSNLPNDALPAFSGNAKPSGLMERFKRLLDPHYQPRLGLRLSGLLTSLPVIGLLLFGLHKGSDQAVAFAAKILTDKERVAAIQTLQKDSPTPLSPGNTKNTPRMRVTGKVVLEDGSPIPEDDNLYFSLISEWSGGTIMSGFTTKPGGTFELNERLEHITIFRVSKGKYAPVFIGPLKPDSNGEIKDIVIELSPGVTTRVRILDPSGHSIENANIVYVIGTPDRFSSHMFTVTTDREGIALVPVTPDSIPFFLKIQADGFENEDRRDISLHSDKILDITLTRAEPVTIHIISESSGNPVSGAAIQLMGTQTTNPNGETNFSGGTYSTIGSTNPNGMFQLSDLRNDTTYHYRIIKNGFRPEYLKNVRTEQNEYTIQLHPPITVHGRILGSLDSFREYAASDEFHLSYRTGWTTGNGGYSQPHKVDIQPIEGGGKFIIKGLAVGTIEFQVDKRQVELKVTESIDDFIINLHELENAFPKRHVLIHLLKPDESSPHLKGQLMVKPMKHLPNQHYEMAELLEVVNGTATVEVETPGAIIIEPYGLVGYYPVLPKHTPHFDVPIGEGPLVIPIKLKRAGALSIDITGSDTNSGLGASISVLPENPSETAFPFNSFNNFFSNRRSSNMTLTPLPLDVPFRIVSHSKYFYTMSESILLTDADPIQSLEIHLNNGASLNGLVRLTSGQPASGIPIRLTYRTPFSLSFGMQEIRTDKNGVFEFQNVNRKVKGSYSLVIEPTKDYIPILKEFVTNWPEMNFELKKGMMTKGRIVDVKTGLPISNATLRAHDFTGNHTHQQAETTTDEEGYFLFTTLAKSEYSLFLNDLNWSAQTQPTITGGSKVVLTYRATIPEWSKHYSSE